MEDEMEPREVYADRRLSWREVGVAWILAFIVWGGLVIFQISYSDPVYRWTANELTRSLHVDH